MSHGCSVGKGCKFLETEHKTFAKPFKMKKLTYEEIEKEIKTACGMLRSWHGEMGRDSGMLREIGSILFVLVLLYKRRR